MPQSEKQIGNAAAAAGQLFEIGQDQQQVTAPQKLLYLGQRWVTTSPTMEEEDGKTTRICDPCYP